uniref:Uncharacterized protein n=1 Tax=Rhizophora mucronata TaxID=61149 RepID=A0A2P2P7D6_RHIMU
MSIKSKFDLYK